MVEGVGIPRESRAEINGSDDEPFFNGRCHYRHAWVIGLKQLHVFVNQITTCPHSFKSDPSVDCVFVSYASNPEIDSRVKHILSWRFYPLSLIQEEQDAIYLQKNGHLILVYCLRESCPGVVWLNV